ncbi:hypothetical protein [uncultured Meiothermus sp.]|uniref:PilW family protein n=1 Tax=uncultured Meiothermus sp. TaxID=157471 RepID=UPI002608EEDF|nr:hypothetical protein [uncultured Meiothermus sp.]
MSFSTSSFQTGGPDTFRPDSRRPRRQPTRTAGLTLIELLVASAVSILILALLVPIVMGSRRLFTLDQARTGVNQELQTVASIIGDDLRQAGQGLLYAGAGYNSSPRPIIVTSGTGGDTLEVWTARNNAPTPIGVCGTVTSTQIPVSSSSSGCAQGDANSNNIPDAAEPFENFRVAQGGIVEVYLYNPATRTGKLVNLTGRTGTAANFNFTYTGPAGGTYGQGSSLIILNRRRYSVMDGQLLISENGGANRVVMVGITQFRAEPLTTTGGAWTPSMQLSTFSQVRLTITARDPQGLTRTQTNTFFPRNFLSQ